MKNGIKKRITCLLIAIMLVAGLSVPAYAADGVRLRWWSAEEKLPFEVSNMFPGDSVTKEYTVEVSHKKPLELHYRADIRPGGEKLAEVLMITVSLPGKNVELYDGLMKDMPKSLDYTLAANEKTLDYKITVYLETSVGNEYMSKNLIADFYWWFQPESETPKTGDEAPVAMYLCLFGGSVAAMLLGVMLLKKKESQNEAE